MVNKGFSLQGLAQHVSSVVGSDVSPTWCSGIMHDLVGGNGVNGRYAPSFRFTGEHAALLSAYAVRWHHKKDSPTMREWMKEHGHKEPKPFHAPVKVNKKPDSQKLNYNQRDIERMIRIETQKALAPIAKELQSIKAMNALAIDDVRSPREAEIEALNKKVRQFAITSDRIGVAGVWTWLERLFEQRNGVKVYKIGKQTFPQWLRSSDYIDTMMNQLQGYLDYMYDSLSEHPVPAHPPTQEYDKRQAELGYDN